MNHDSRHCSRVASAVPWYSSSSWTPAISSPWRVRKSSRRRRQGPVEHEQPAAGRERRPRGPQRRDRVAAAGAARTGSRPGRSRPPPPALVTSPCRISIRSAARPPSTLARARVDRVGLELDADELERREPAGHRDEPASAAAMDVDHAATAAQVADELRAARRAPPGRRPRRPGRSGARSIGGSGRADAGSARPSGRSRAWPTSPATRSPSGRTGRRGTRAGLVEQDHRRVVVEHETAVAQLGELVGVGRRGPGFDRARRRTRSAASSAAVRPSRPASRSWANRPSSTPRYTSQVRWNPVRVSMSSSNRSSRRIVAGLSHGDPAPPDGSVQWRDRDTVRCRMQRSAPTGGSGDRWTLTAT